MLKTKLLLLLTIVCLLDCACVAPPEGQAFAAEPDVQAEPAHAAMGSPAEDAPAEPPASIPLASQRRSSNGEITFEDGEQLAGQYSAVDFLVPAGHSVSVVGNLALVASGSIRIEGDLIAIDVQPGVGDEIDAPSIWLESEVGISVTGCIFGGKGASYGDLPGEDTIGKPGGDGSSIVLAAPDLLAVGGILAGHGGVGGNGEDGGQGGSLLFYGALIGSHGLTTAQLGDVRKYEVSSAGKGGRGGVPSGSIWNAGNSGNSGDYMERPFGHESYPPAVVLED